MKKYPAFIRKINLLKERFAYKIHTRRNGANIPISETEFTVLDVESTGVNYKTDKILSIGAVKTTNNEIDIENTFEVYLKQKFDNNSAVRIHGILPNGAIDKLEEKEALDKLLNYVGDTIIVGHNINFDISIINIALAAYGMPPLNNLYLDTIDLYKRVKSGTNKIAGTITLDEACREFNIPLSDRHNSAGDAYITSLLFIKLLNRLQLRGVNTIKELMKKSRII